MTLSFAPHLLYHSNLRYYFYGSPFYIIPFFYWLVILYVRQTPKLAMNSRETGSSALRFKNGDSDIDYVDRLTGEPHIH